jgi:dienelactone hydrolase
MINWYSRRIEAWEQKLCFRTNDRVVRPFDWGLEWSERWPQTSQIPMNGFTPREYYQELNRAAIEDSHAFFGYEKPVDFELKDDVLRFTSPVHTPYPENNTVVARYFPVPNTKKAVVVLPHWNAPADGHLGLCRGLQKLGIACLRISLPYHDFRMPAELHRADYAVSSNIGRTIDATRQAVIDVRACYDWLETQGYDRFGVVGTSLGSCYACLAATHDDRIQVNVFNHCSTYFADVVWTGLSTQHIREGMEGHIDVDELREAWLAISPVKYLERLAERRTKSLFIYTTYDTTFLPRYSKDIIQRVRELNVDHKVAVLPCGHYTMGETPFKFMDGYHIISFMKRNL